MLIYRIDNNYCQKVSEQVLQKHIYLIKCKLIRVNILEEEPKE